MKEQNQKRDDCRVAAPDEHPFLHVFTVQQRSAMERIYFTPTEDRERQKPITPEEKEIAAAISESSYKQQRTDFIQKIMEYRSIEIFLQNILLENYRRKSGDRTTQKTDRTESEQAETPSQNGYKNHLETIEDYGKLNAHNMWRYFDGVAYMEALRQSIRKYDLDWQGQDSEQKPSFWGLFDSCYQKCLNQQKRKAMLVSVPSEKWNLLNKISIYLKKEGLSPDDLRQNSRCSDIIGNIASVLNLQPEHICELLLVLRNIQTLSLDTPVGEEGDTTMTDFLPDTLEDAEERFWGNWLAFSFIQQACQKDLTEYNRLLMTNLLLHPLHPETGPQPPVKGAKAYAENLQENESDLYQNVFLTAYLDFISWRTRRAPDVKADPADINVLCYGYPLRELNALSIASYKNVTPANVTYYNRKFTSLLEEVAERAVRAEY